RFLTPIQENNDNAALEDLRARIYPFILRRLKRDVLTELPAKTEETVSIALEEAHHRLYHTRREAYKRLISGILHTEGYGKGAFVILKALSELRRLASVPERNGEGVSAKRRYLTERVREIAAGGHKCLIFTNFLAAVDLISRDLEDCGIAHLVMTGAVSNRAALTRRFQTDPEVKAFVMTLKTGGTGLNLTAADYVFIFDPWWNGAAEQQAVDRIHRIGQENPVFCYRLIAKDTIEERMTELQQRKSALSGALLQNDAETFKSLTPEDLMFLVGDVYGL
ncbi:MAG: hypothetical protein LBD24_09075, partial [Spirochaetaceae bacterium]|nr:hypothetical protein [Spirochaetaceae bacterium]